MLQFRERRRHFKLMTSTCKRSIQQQVVQHSFSFKCFMSASSFITSLKRASELILEEALVHRGQTARPGELHGPSDQEVPSYHSCNLWATFEALTGTNPTVFWQLHAVLLNDCRKTGQFIKILNTHKVHHQNRVRSDRGF